MVDSFCSPSFWTNGPVVVSCPSVIGTFSLLTLRATSKYMPCFQANVTLAALQEPLLAVFKGRVAVPILVQVIVSSEDSWIR